MAVLFRNATVLSMTDPVKATPFVANVGVESNRIVMIDTDEARLQEFVTRNADCLTEIDASSKILMPGLINTHTHVSMTLMRCFADDITLMSWLNDHIWPFEAKLNADDIALGARLGMAEMMLGGTTSFVDMYWYESAVARQAKRMGMRAAVSPCFVDSRMEAFEVDLVDSLREAEGCDRVQVFVAPHAPYSCSLANLKRGASLSRQYNLPVHIHLSETTDEVNMVRQTYDMTPTEFIDSLGYFDQPTIAAHCVRLTEGDVSILRDKGVTAVHNPQSNMKLSSGISPVWHLLQNGVNVALGTDGTCSNNDLDMWDEMRTAALLQKVSGTDPTVLPAYEALRMATVYGAKALGKEGELGVISEGALADIILIDTSRPHLHPMNDIVSALVYCGKASDVSTVMIDGRIVVKDGVIEDVNLPELYSEIDACISSIKQRA